MTDQLPFPAPFWGPSKADRELGLADKIALVGVPQCSGRLVPEACVVRLDSD
jgi:hypothetical protein